MEPVKQFEAEGIVPVIKLSRSEDALRLADVLSEAGIHIAEITFRTDAAADAIRNLRKHRSNLLVGAGTVLTMEQLDAAEAAGASFIVSPGFNPRIVESCLKRNLPIFPGVNSPSQVEVAMNYGLELLKFFPAELSGGIPMLKALGAVYPVRFMPTGGLNIDNIMSYLRLPNVLACGASWMVRAEYIDNGAFDTIRDLSSAVKAKINSEKYS